MALYFAAISRLLIFALLFHSTVGFIDLVFKLVELADTIASIKEANKKPAAQNPLKDFECLAVYAPIRCGTEDGGAIALLVDEDDWPSHDCLDKLSFSGKHSAVVLSGCANDPGDGKIEPELVIIHTCKGDQAKRIRIPIPRDAVTKFGSGKLKYHKFNEVIDLKANHKGEENWPQCATC